MGNGYLALVAIGGVAAVIVAVTWLRIHPFVALLTAAIGTGLAAGMAPADVIAAVTAGMGNALGFVAVVVGLGSMFGMMLEESVHEHPVPVPILLMSWNVLDSAARYDDSYNVVRRSKNDP